MDVKNLETYSAQLFEQMGPKAIAHAAQKAVECEAKGQADNAETWRRIERALLERRGPHQS